MPEKTPHATLRRIRDMIRKRYTNKEISRICGVCEDTVTKQALLIAVCEGRNRTENCGLSGAAHGARSISLWNSRKGHKFDENKLDLVDIFSTPRSPRQLARYMGDDW